MSDAEPLRVAVLISGGGTNLQALIDSAHGDFPARIVAVISNVADAFGLERARRAGIPTEVLDHRDFPSRDAFDAALADKIESHRAGLVALAGFMRILTPRFVRRFSGRLLNIHPSLLPKFRGLHTHQRALDADETEHGASVHFVTDELDGGPLIVQARVPVQADDDAERLARRVLAREHVIYPLAVRWFAEGRIRLDAGRVLRDGQPQRTPPVLAPQDDGAAL